MEHIGKYMKQIKITVSGTLGDVTDRPLVS